MMKLLLIGNLNKTIKGIQDAFMDEYQVQVCSERLDNVKEMMNLLKPNIVVISQIGLGEEDIEIYNLMKNRYSWVPVLVIALDEKKDHFAELEENNDKFKAVYRPVTKAKLLECSKKLLGTDKSKGEAEDESGSSADQILKSVDISQTRGKYKIMIVDDSTLILRNITRLLEERYLVTTASSGQEAVQLIDKKKPDLILLDYEMPVWDGKKTFEVLKKMPEAQDIPVVFLTGQSDKEHIMSVLQLNPAGYLLKPPVQERLFETIDKILGK